MHFFLFQVTWSVPPENKYKPNGFKLYYRKMNSEKKFGPINLTANTTQFLLGDLGEFLLFIFNIENVFNSCINLFTPTYVHCADSWVFICHGHLCIAQTYALYVERF